MELLNSCAGIAIPEKISLERVPTSNGHGYIFYITSPVAQEFIDNADATKSFLEIGAGFSKTAEQCLRKGILEYTVNDLSLEHLKIMCVKLEDAFGHHAPEYMSHLNVLPGRAPQALSTKENYYDAILLDKVLHFFSPQESEDFLAWAHSALKVGGRLYIFTISPYCKGYKVDEVYKEQKMKSDYYPGYIENVHNYLKITSTTNPQYAVPQSMIFFMLDDLKNLLESKNFKIEKTFTTQLPRQETPFWIEVSEPQCDLVGIVAQKQLTLR